MLNNRLEDLIYKYKSYRIKLFIKQIVAIAVAIIVTLGLYSLYIKLSFYHEKKLNKKELQKQVNKSINHDNHEKNETKKEPKPTIIKIVKKPKINEDKILKKNTLATYKILEKTKPTYKTAIDLARYYFENGDYKKAAKWAIVASNREPKYDEAWIIYAKSKVKLNQKGMAKKALKIYLLKYKSTRVSNLLNSL